MQASGRLAVEQLSSLCAARKRSRGNRVRVDGAGSRDASDRQRGKDLPDPRACPERSRRVSAQNRGANLGHPSAWLFHFWPANISDKTFSSAV
jgi:hypothetical protein